MSYQDDKEYALGFLFLWLVLIPLGLFLARSAWRLAEW